MKTSLLWYLFYSANCLTKRLHSQAPFPAAFNQRSKQLLQLWWTQPTYQSVVTRVCTINTWREENDKCLVCGDTTHRFLVLLSMRDLIMINIVRTARLDKKCITIINHAVVFEAHLPNCEDWNPTCRPDDKNKNTSSDLLYVNNFASSSKCYTPSLADDACDLSTTQWLRRGRGNNRISQENNKFYINSETPNCSYLIASLRQMACRWVI